MISLISILLTLFLGNNKSFDAQLKNYLDAKLKSYDKYEFQVVRLPNSYSKIEINKGKEFRINRGYGLVPVDVYTNRNSVSSAMITVRVKLFKNVFVAAQKINRDQALSKKMFVRKIEDVTNIEGSFVESENELSLYRSKFAFRQGSVLVKEMIEPIPVVNVGDRMLLHTGKNGVDVTLDVVARQEGCLNDIINVQAEGNVFKAKIIDQYNLLLEE